VTVWLSGCRIVRRRDAPSSCSLAPCLSWFWRIVGRHISGRVGPNVDLMEYQSPPVSFDIRPRQWRVRGARDLATVGVGDSGCAGGVNIVARGFNCPR
jgi:hypothetical protein